MRGETLLNQGAVTVEVHTQLINDSKTRERKKAIINHPLIHATLIISAMNITVGNQIRASDMDGRIILFRIVPKQTLRIRNLTGTRISLKLLPTC